MKVGFGSLGSEENREPVGEPLQLGSLSRRDRLISSTR